MPKYTLHYFPPRGQTEPARLMLASKGVEFKDVKIPFEDWPKYKPQAPTNQLPYIEVDGTLYGQSVAIHNYIARELGYYGSSNIENLEIDQVVQTANEFFNETKKAFFGPAEKQEELFKTYYEELLPRYAAILTKMLNKYKSGFFVGNKLTLADFEVFDVLSITEKKNKGALGKYPELNAFYNKISAIPKIKEYIALRPDAGF